MCLILVALQQHPDYPLVVAANRDEFHARPTDAAHWWHDPLVLAGRDREAGGTWFAVAPEGRFAAVTNYRDPAGAEPGRRSRGELPLRALALPPERVAAELEPELDAYGGVNLLTGDAGGLLYLSNRGDPPTRVAPGVHALSNGRLDTPWPKAVRGRERLATRLATGHPDLKALYDLLGDRNQPPDEALPDTGVGRDLERLLAPIFIRSATYGTRSATVLLVDAVGTVTFGERRFDPEGRIIGSTREHFRITGR